MHIEFIRGVVVFAERIKDYDASRVAVTVYCIIFVNLFFFSVKDGYNNLFAGNCKRHDRTYNTYRDGRWVSSLNNTLKLHSAIFMLFFFFKQINFVNIFWLPIISGRIQDIALVYHR